METEISPRPAGTARRAREETAFAVLLALSFSHLLNDLIQSLIPAIYPLLKESFRLSCYPHLWPCRSDDIKRLRHYCLELRLRQAHSYQ